MDPKLIAEALDALIAGDATKCQEILKGLIAGAAGADVAEPPGTEAPAAMADAPPADEKKPDVMAASARLMRLTGKTTIVDAVAEVEVWRTSHIELETERQKLAAERATLEMAERRKLCVELVTLGAEFPATVWADPLKPTTLKSRWLSMPIAELRTHVTEQRAARPNAGKNTPEPPRSGETESGGKSFVVNGKTIALSASELEACAEMGAKPEDYAANKAVVMRSKSAS